MNNADLLARKNAATPRGVGVMCEFYAERAENAEIWDVEGKRYIDFGGGIAVVNTGHRHPKQIAAIAEQLNHFTHTCYQVVPYESYVRLAERVNEAAPITRSAADGASFQRSATAPRRARNPGTANALGPGITPSGIGGS